MNGKDLAAHGGLGVLVTILTKKPIAKQIDKLNISDEQKATYKLTSQGAIMGAFIGDYVGLEKNHGSKNFTPKERGLSVFLGAVAGGVAAYAISSYITPNSRSQSGGSPGAAATVDDDPAQAGTDDDV